MGETDGGERICVSTVPDYTLVGLLRSALYTLDNRANNRQRIICDKTLLGILCNESNDIHISHFLRSWSTRLNTDSDNWHSPRVETTSFYLVILAFFLHFAYFLSLSSLHHTWPRLRYLRVQSEGRGKGEGEGEGEGKQGGYANKHDADF